MSPPRTICKAVQPCCKPLMPTGWVQSQGQPPRVVSSLGPHRVTRDRNLAQLRISPLTKQTGPRNKVPIIGKAVLTASRGCLFWIPGPHGKAQDACEVLAEGGKPLATRWAHATTTTPGMQLMQNGSDFPHYGCGIALELLGAGMALELPPRLGDNQCARTSLCRGPMCSSQPFHSTALPGEPCHPGALFQLCLCLGSTHTAALCVQGVAEQQGGHQEPWGEGERACPTCVPIQVWVL